MATTQSNGAAHPVLRLGDRGEEVRTAQSQLKSLKVLRVNPTGYFGPTTQNAVEKLQRDNHINHDGVIGKDTWDLLLPARSNRTDTGTEPSQTNTRKPTTNTEQQRRTDRESPPEVEQPQNTPTAPVAPAPTVATQVPIDSQIYDRLSKRTIQRGDYPDLLARELVRTLSAEQTQGLVRAGYVQAPSAYTDLLESRKAIQTHRDEIAAHEKELQTSIDERTRSLHKARRNSDRRYINSLIRSDRKRMGALDKETRGVDRQETTLNKQLQTHERKMQSSVQSELKKHVLHDLPRTLIAGRKVNLLEAAGLSDLVTRQEPPKKPARERRQGGTVPAFRVNPSTLRNLKDNPNAVLAVREAKKNGIPPELFMGLITQESGWNPNAVSPANCQGIAQFMPSTAARFGCDDPFDPKKAIPAAARYVRYLHRLFPDDWHVAIAAYNAGEGNVMKYGRQIPPFPETQTHNERTFGYMDALVSLGGADYIDPPKPTTHLQPRRAKHPRSRDLPGRRHG